MQDSQSKIRYLRRRLDSLNAALVKFHDARERLTPGGQELLDWSMAHLHDARSDLEHKLRRNLRVQDIDRREDARRTLCDEVAVSIEDFANFVLPALNGARSDRVPVELEPIVQRLAASADPKRDVTVVLYGADVVGYAINFPPDYYDLPAAIMPRAPGTPPTPDKPKVGAAMGDDDTDDTDDEDDTLPQPVALPHQENGPPRHGPNHRFVSVRIPAIDRDSGTMHSLALGHELGHLRVKGQNLTKRVKNRPPQAWQDPARPGEVNVERFLELFNIYSELVHQWGQELLADIIAVKVLGPAALLAFGELVGTRGNWERDNPTHPGSDRRCALMLRLLQRDGFAQFPELRPALDHYTHLCKDAVTRPVFMRNNSIAESANSPRQLAWNEILDQLDEIVEFAVASVQPEDSFGVEDFRLAVTGQDVLAAGRPFAEHGAESTDPGDGRPTRGPFLPVRVPTILNAAWLVKINRLKELGNRVNADADSDNDYARICAVLDGLVLKSIEVSEYQRGLG